jgi:transposase
MKIGLNIQAEGWHTGMYESTTFPTSYQLAGRTRPAALAEGPQALRHRKPPGRRSKLTHQQRLQLLELLAQGTQAFGFRGDLWTQPRVAQVIRRHFGVQYHPSQVGRILKQYDWSRQQPIRRAAQRDEEAIQHWKEERWPALKKRLGRKAGPSSS